MLDSGEDKDSDGGFGAEALVIGVGNMVRVMRMNRLRKVGMIPEDGVRLSFAKIRRPGKRI